MSRIGDELDALGDEFNDWLGETFEVTNYRENPNVSDPAPGEYESADTKQETSASPLTVTGTIEQPDTYSHQNNAWGKSVALDVVLLLDDTVTISDGTADGLPYASRVVRVDTDAVYMVTATHREGNGLIACAAKEVGER